MVMGSLKQEAEVAVVGAGPGGYVAALRAADLGKEVVLIEERERLGGVCLLEGCIPSKTLINAVDLAESAKAADRIGLSFRELAVDLDKLRAWNQSVIHGLTSGIAGLLERRGVEVIRGRARLEGPHELAIDGADVSGIRFRQCILATGSRIHEIPASYDVPVWSSAEALRLPTIPERLAVVGGGYIGLEMGLVYAGLGSKVTVVEFFPGLLQGADRDLVDVMLRSCEKRFEAIRLESKVTGIEQTSDGFALTV
jgi:dihydrolipoamide dehydrogenase